MIKLILQYSENLNIRVRGDKLAQKVAQLNDEIAQLENNYQQGKQQRQFNFNQKAEVLRATIAEGNKVISVPITQPVMIGGQLMYHNPNTGAHLQETRKTFNTTPYQKQLNQLQTNFNTAENQQQQIYASKKRPLQEELKQLKECAGQTALHFAVRTGNKDAVKLLLKVGANGDNEQQGELENLKIKMKELQLINSKNIYPDKDKYAIKIQAVARGFFARKKFNLSDMKAKRKSEIEAKIPDVMVKLSKEGRYDDIAKLADTIKNHKLHEANKIIENMPELELSSKGSNNVFKY